MAPKHCIYIVDDDEDDTYFMQQALLESGNSCEVKTFSNGAELVKNIADANRTSWPSFIILDLNMPVMDGFETLGYLKKNPMYGKIPILVMTTSSSEADVIRSYNLGSNSFIVKPTDFGQLKEVVSRTLNYWLLTTTLPAIAG